MALVGRGCKLDLKLVSALVERGRAFTVGVVVDGSVVTRYVQSGEWQGVCGEVLGSISETIYGGRIKIAWLRRTLVALDEDSTKIERERHTWTYILQIIGGILMPDKSRTLVHLRWLLKLIDF
ncbi:hypothetical protein Gotri_012340 [Gossypium trilobum]|uniref:Uncharacterized protein n=1 Tax=Gossypium trilobum TaxID=34281 RepID=A0A7J9DPV2_9ROSI|nr:hypothetical protein [Gossypium trilobum]